MKTSYLLILIYFLILSRESVANIEKSLYVTQPDKVCWYQGKAFSEGGLIKQFDLLYVCTFKFKNQPNSKLVWIRADENGHAIRLDVEKRIRVK